jgi:hypothetical protein
MTDFQHLVNLFLITANKIVNILFHSLYRCLKKLSLGFVLASTLDASGQL